MDELINYGSGIKSKDDGTITGKLVIFSTENDPDLSGDYFTKDTDFGFEGSIKSPVWLHHRRPLKTRDGKQLIKKEKIGEATLTKTDDGIMVDAILYNHEQYKGALNALGWSSGTAAHLVEREKKGAANFVKQWLLGLDASMTPIPCEPRTSPSIKSLAEGDFEYQSDFIIEDNSLKAVEKEAAKSDQLDALIDPNLRAGLRFEQRLDVVLAANEQVINDAKEIHEMRKAQKAGRKISSARMTKLKEVMGQLQALISEVDGEGMEAEQPDSAKSADQSEILSLVAQFEHIKAMPNLAS